MTRLFFATDLHGSEVCWKKFLNAGKFYQADVLVLGGDMTGKAIVPIVRRPDGKWKVTLSGQEQILQAEPEVQAVEQQIANRGYYSLRTTAEKMQELAGDTARLDRLFHEQILRTVEAWMTLADQRLAGAGIDCYVCPGNDDQFEVDEIIARSRSVQLAEGQVLTIRGGFEMISSGWSNPTPWNTYREELEVPLRQRIEKMAGQVRAMDKAIFNLHAPPYGSCLDEAPDLDETLKPRHAGKTSVPVGSSAVYDSLMAHQPMLSLHGHIHESKGAVRLGRTVAINPGSLYEQGVLLGVLVDIDMRKGVRNYVLTTG